MEVEACTQSKINEANIGGISKSLEEFKELSRERHIEHKGLISKTNDKIQYGLYLLVGGFVLGILNLASPDGTFKGLLSFLADLIS
jgi:hypothetical protein